MQQTSQGGGLSISSKKGRDVLAEVEANVAFLSRTLNEGWVRDVLSGGSSADGYMGGSQGSVWEK